MSAVHPSCEERDEVVVILESLRNLIGVSLSWALGIQYKTQLSNMSDVKTSKNQQGYYMQAGTR